MSHLQGFPDLPPVWALGFVGAQWLAGRSIPIWEFGRLDLAGWMLVASGVALILWAAVQFQRRGTPIEPRQEPRALITEGPYRINRNPIYSGMAIALLGSALLFGTLSAVLVATLFPGVMTHRFIRWEEDALRRRQGASAEDFFRRTRRW